MPYVQTLKLIIPLCSSPGAPVAAIAPLGLPHGRVRPLSPLRLRSGLPDDRVLSPRPLGAPRGLPPRRIRPPRLPGRPGPLAASAGAVIVWAVSCDQRCSYSVVFSTSWMMKVKVSQLAGNSFFFVNQKPTSGRKRVKSDRRTQISASSRPRSNYDDT